jgi:hypothetical protein
MLCILLQPENCTEPSYSWSKVVTEVRVRRWLRWWRRYQKRTIFYFQLISAALILLSPDAGRIRTRNIAVIIFLVVQQKQLNNFPSAPLPACYTSSADLDIVGDAIPITSVQVHLRPTFTRNPQNEFHQFSQIPVKVTVTVKSRSYGLWSHYALW